MILYLRGSRIEEEASVRPERTLKFLLTLLQTSGEASAHLIRRKRSLNIRRSSENRVIRQPQLLMAAVAKIMTPFQSLVRRKDLTIATMKEHIK